MRRGIARVVSEMIEFDRSGVEEFDQLPVALSDRAGGTASEKVWFPQRIVPIERVAIELHFRVSQDRQDRNAIEALSSIGPYPGALEQRWIEVDVAGWLAAHGAGRNDLRPADDERHADAAFV